MFRIHGLPDAAPVPDDYLELVHPDDRQLVEATFQRSVETGSHHAQYRVLWPDGSVHWVEGVGQTVRGPSGEPLSISGVCTQIDAQKRIESDLRFLAAASAELAVAAETEETLRRIAALAVPQFADWCAIDMLNEHGELRRVAVAHADPGRVALAKQLHEQYPPDKHANIGVWNVLREGKAELVPEISDELLERTARSKEHLSLARALGLRSYMAVPLIGAAGVRGAVTFVSSESGRIFDGQDLQLASDLVGRASVALQNAELLRSLRASQARQGFLLAITDALRSDGDTLQRLLTTSALAGAHFGANRVGFGHVDESLDQIAYDVCWTDGTVPPLLGEFAASAFGPQVIARLRAGSIVAIGDVRHDPLTSELQTIRTSHEVDTRAILVVPLFDSGRLRTIVYLNGRSERTWTSDEVSLMGEVAERTRELIERSRAESALRASEGRWRGLFDAMSEGFFTAEVIRDGAGAVCDFRFLDVNPAFETLTGILASAAMHRNVSEVIPGFPLDIVGIYARVVESGEPADFEVQVPALRDRWYEARARRMDAHRFMVMFLEVTERKRVQQELVASAHRYHTLFESIDEGFCILEVLLDNAGVPCDYLFLEVNPAFARQSGLNNAVGRTIRELIPDIESNYIDTYGRVALTGESIRFESHAKALKRWFDAFAFRVGDPSLRRVALVFSDITERKAAQTALAEREYELEESQRLARIGSWVWDVQGESLEISPQMRHIFGLEPGFDFPSFEEQREKIYPAEDWERLLEANRIAIDSNLPYSMDLRAWRGRQSIWVTARGTPVREHGRVVKLRGNVQDITERKLIEEALRAADARKNEFLATLAHELRNPLAPLRNGLAILERVGSSTPEERRARELMERQLAHLVRLVDDLLDVSRVSLGKVEMKRSITTLRPIVEHAVETVRPLVEARGHRLEVDLHDADEMTLDVDPTRMAQVLGNLLGNAAKYTPRSGLLRLDARRTPAGGLRIDVRDNGEGIPRDMLEKVFDLFTQVGTSLERSQGGLGIGLSLARQLVELHGGTVRAESGGKDRGSCFIVELPATSISKTAWLLPAPSSSVVTGRRVLLVDDNMDAAESLGALLQLEGHEVEIVHRGLEALEAAKRRPPEVVLLDIGLPDLTGYEVAARLRQQPSLEATLIVAVTGWGSEGDRQRGREAGIDWHLTKPVTLDDLAHAISSQLRQTQAT